MSANNKERIANTKCKYKDYITAWVEYLETADQSPYLIIENLRGAMKEAIKL